jgi:hypothetical protein
VNLRGALAAAALTLLAATFAGCSGGRDLGTPGQAAGFVVEVAGGESPGDWTLSGKPAAEARQAWTDRQRIVDLGRRLRREGSSWACEFAHKSVALGSIGSFNANDSGIVSRQAAEQGIGSKAIAALLHDVVALRYRELVLATTSICGPYKT